MIDISEIRKKPMDDRIEAIADYYGIEVRGRQLQEECAELIQAVSKLYRADTDEERTAAIDHVAEELADVDICMAEMAYLLKLGVKIFEWEAAKVNRELDRIEKREENTK